jgi:uncharacterized protein HemY
MPISVASAAVVVVTIVVVLVVAMAVMMGIEELARIPLRMKRRYSRWRSAAASR